MSILEKVKRKIFRFPVDDGKLSKTTWPKVCLSFFAVAIDKEGNDIFSHTVYIL